MPVKSGTSHALATFILMIISGILVAQYHSIYDYSIEKIALLEFICNQANFIENLMYNSGYIIDAGVIEAVITATILSFVWGIVYHFSRDN